jgi:uncharacterized protein YecT (DUF1311 family)
MMAHMSTRALVLLTALGGALAPAVSLDLENQLSGAEEIIDRCGKQWGFAGPVATCIENEAKRYARALEAEYQKAVKTAGDSRELLVSSQRAWLNFQTADCKLAEAMAARDGPSFKRSAAAACDIRTSLERLRTLERLFQ